MDKEGTPLFRAFNGVTMGMEADFPRAGTGVVVSTAIPVIKGLVSTTGARRDMGFWEF